MPDKEDLERVTILCLPVSVCFENLFGSYGLEITQRKTGPGPRDVSELVSGLPVAAVKDNLAAHTHRGRNRLVRQVLTCLASVMVVSTSITAASVNLLGAGVYARATCNTRDAYTASTATAKHDRCQLTVTANNANTQVRADA